MAEVKSHIDNSSEPDKCETLWGRNECPNAPAFLIVTISRPGFAVMCEPHKEGYEKFQRGHDYRVEPYSLERAKELQAQVDAVYKVSAN